ncbi:uncharacterized protein BJ171DRAFT_143237 [Polychytrium aggregatum]|uniref:uncharacterized protein n=1 Tax=Polychytrium aggregatum TaxID=110093 RepID=UPI0022FF4053|nr:uncharacterized protein BJ171DRAFT_143237 [Polychytrium aggregatum]KAI9203403.1 hypothetical protein BJ171DRAFT_143237 [Polychytrium aggregatum]
MATATIDLMAMDLSLETTAEQMTFLTGGDDTPSLHSETPPDSPELQVGPVLPLSPPASFEEVLSQNREWQSQPPYPTPPQSFIAPKPSPPVKRPGFPLRHDGKLDLAALPSAIIEAIVAQLPSLVDKKNCLLVCRTWSKGASKAIYRRPHLPTIRHFQDLVYTLLRPNLSHPYSRWVEEFVIRKELDEDLFMGDIDVALQLFYNLQAFHMEYSISASNVLVQSLADHNRNLRCINLRGCPVSDSYILELCQSCPKLRTINLADTNCTAFVLKHIIDHCAWIQSIDLENCHKTSMPLEFDPRESFTRPLQHLNATNSGISDHVLRFVALRCPDIVSANLEGCLGLSDDSLIRLIQTSCGLKYLNVAFVNQLTDLTAIAIGFHSFDIQVVMFSGCDLISPVGVQMLVQRCANLKELILHGCAGILNTYIREYSSRLHDIDCSIRGPSIKWLAGHNTLKAKDAPVKEMKSEMVQTEFVDTSALVPKEQFDASEILLKFAEAAASGKWVPQSRLGAAGAKSIGTAGDKAAPTESGAWGSGPPPPGWNPAWASYGNPAPGERRLERESNESLASSVSSTASRFRSKIPGLSRIPTPPASPDRRSVASSVGSTPSTSAPSVTSSTVSRLPTSMGGSKLKTPTRLPLSKTTPTARAPLSLIQQKKFGSSPASSGLATPSKTSTGSSTPRTLSKRTSSGPAPTPSKTSTPATPSSAYKPRQFKKFNDDEFASPPRSVARLNDSKPSTGSLSRTRSTSSGSKSTSLAGASSFSSSASPSSSLSTRSRSSNNDAAESTSNTPGLKRVKSGTLRSVSTSVSSSRTSSTSSTPVTPQSPSTPSKAATSNLPAVTPKSRMTGLKLPTPVKKISTVI